MWLAYWSLLSSMLFECINLVILFSRTTVYTTIVSYITVDILKGYGTFYFNSIESDPQNILSEVLDKENGL